MTRIEFQNNHGGELKKFLESPVGQSLLNMLSGLRPPYEANEHAHLYANNRGKVEGYEICLRTLLTLSLPAKPNQEPEANYGVPDKA